MDFNAILDVVMNKLTDLIVQINFQDILSKLIELVTKLVTGGAQ